MAAAALAAALALSLAGCGGSGVNSFTWFVEELPSNLDPQVAYAQADVIACRNLYGTLLRRDPDGALRPDLCESYSVSADGLRYTFVLKDGLVYTAAKGAPTEYAITAEDFVFAFRRMFRAETRSPYAAEFAALANSAAVLDGSLDESALGVTAAGPLTLVFTLSEPDSNFLSKLTLPGASPCDEEFFDSTRSTYGLTTASTLSSGSFYIYNWTSSGLFLRRSAAAPLVDSLRLVQNTGTVQTAEQLILNERCTAALDDTGADASLRSVEYSDTTWCLLFNCAEGSVFSSAALRQALTASARTAAQVPDSGLYAPVGGLVPDGLMVDGLSYRQRAGNPTPALGDARSLYLEARQGMANSDFNQVTLLLPAGAGLTGLAEQINSQWQKELSLFFSIQEVEQEEFDQRMAAGNYTLAIAPVSASSGSVYALLSQFGPGGLTGYDDADYAARLAASTSVTGEARCALLAECERQLLADCAAAPLFAQQKRLLLADGVDGLVFDPYGPVLDLTYTTKE